ncbi:hypothetical protein PG991_003733, partial [Apiospora marii]
WQEVAFRLDSGLKLLYHGHHLEGFLQQEGWHPNFREPTNTSIEPVYLSPFFAWVSTACLPGNMALLVRTLQIDKMKADLRAGMVFERPTIFRSMLESELPERDTGTETTSWALSVITFRSLYKPHLLEKLRRERLEADLTCWLLAYYSEKIPVSSARIQEGLRLSYGVATRTARVATGEAPLYRDRWKEKLVDYTIPKGYAIGMPTVITHYDENVFPNSHTFVPEHQLARNTSATRKSSACVAMKQVRLRSLAYCRLYLGLAALALRVLPQMRLFDATDEDVTWNYNLLGANVEAKQQRCSRDSQVVWSREPTTTNPSEMLILATAAP